MTDLKVPNLNKNSDKYLFKKKLSLRRKSKSKLLRESFLMLLLSNLILVINYSIPRKKIIFDNIYINLSGLFNELYDAVNYFYQLVLAIFIVISLVFAIILIIGSVSRLTKIIRRKSKRISFK